MPPVVLGDFAVPVERTGEHRFPLHASPAEEKEGTKKINNTPWVTQRCLQCTRDAPSSGSADPSVWTAKLLEKGC